MLSLQAILTARSHRDLELTARAHKQPFSRRVPKAEGLQQVLTALESGGFRRAIKCLIPAEIEALQALVAHGGMLDERRFS